MARSTDQFADVETGGREVEGEGLQGDEVEEEEGGRKKKQQKKKKPVRFYLAVLGLDMMVFIVSLDATMLAIAIPTVAEQLHGTTLQAFWASLSFMLAMVITQPIITSFSNILGRLIPLYCSFVFFLIGSIVFGTAKDLNVVIVGRIFQGLGAGGLDVLGDIIITDITTLKERPLYLGVLQMCMASGSILGPVFGALFVEYAGWQWIGWINVPVAVIACLLVVFFVKLRWIAIEWSRVDWTGMVLLIIGFTAFTLPLSWADSMYPWSSWRTIIPLIIGFLVLVIMAVYEKYPREPIFPYRIFNSRTAAATFTGAFLHGMVVYALVVYVPLYFQGVQLKLPLEACVSVLPFSFSIVVSSVASALVVEWLLKYRWTLWCGWVVMIVGVGLMCLWDRYTSVALIAVFQVIAGIGMGTLFFVLVLPVQASVKLVDDQGIAIGTLLTFRLFGGLVGLAVGSAAFNGIYAREIMKVVSLPASLADLRSSKHAVGFIPHLRTLDVDVETLDGVLDAYMKAIRAIFYIMTALGVLGFAVSLFTKELSLRNEELGRQRYEMGSVKERGGARGEGEGAWGSDSRTEVASGAGSEVVVGGGGGGSGGDVEGERERGEDVRRERVGAGSKG
ncbi:MFS general substrate transporter [Aulographum hederae CBS 113979]|uniref:MFS general substrate transporter n=1 Tax=Aulographum hederae CBS 113979 TaxID=1176131 RepID=A0A6G1HAA7_9PEZI|nr:MFS general substrate transporter [Aulographum hederae CBS 113979]